MGFFSVLRSHCSATVGRFGRDARGSVAAIGAIVFPLLIGGMGLGAEVSYWYVQERDLQHAADVAAFAAGVRLNNGDSKATLDAVALNVASKSGFTPARGTIEVHNGPTSGPNAGDKLAVEVILKEEVDRYFTTFFSTMSTPAQ